MLGKLVAPDKKGSTQLTKAKPVPVWVYGDFEVSRLEVDAWSKSNKDSDFVKYQDLVESLKKNNGVKDYFITVVLDRTSDEPDKTVAKVLQLMSERFAKTATEKSKDAFDKIVNFRMKDDETCEEYWDCFQAIITDVERENL
jgi:uncharacterized linocin/CFP29 family protein